MMAAGRDGIEKLTEYGGTASDTTIRHHGIGARAFVMPAVGDFLR
jgi:hypothetical protein